MYDLQIILEQDREIIYYIIHAAQSQCKQQLF